MMRDGGEGGRNEKLLAQDGAVLDTGGNVSPALCTPHKADAMPDISYACPSCQRTVTVPAKVAGKRLPFPQWRANHRFVLLVIGIILLAAPGAWGAWFLSQKPENELPKKRDSDLPKEEKQRIRARLEEAKARRPKPEPLPKPELWTELEYKLALAQPSSVFLRKPSAEQAKHIVRNGGIKDAQRELFPRSVKALEREAWKQILDNKPSDDALDRMVFTWPQLRPLKSKKVQEALRSRAPWVERKDLYEQLSKITGDDRQWSLLHPFDELDQRSMERVIQIASQAKREGYGILDLEKRALLLGADQLEFMSDLLLTPEERGQVQAEKDRQRRVSDEAARQQHQKERANEKQREAARQRQMRIERQDKEAKKLLRAALLLDSRNGFEKQVGQRLQEIIDKYPDTPSAEKARKRLESLKPSR